MKPVYWFIAPTALLLVFAAAFSFRNQEKVEAAALVASSASISPDQLAPALLKGRFDWVYSRMTKELQKEVPKEEFKKLMTQFHKGIVTYRPEIRYRLNGVLAAIGLSQDKTKGYQVIYNSSKQISSFIVQSELPSEKKAAKDLTKNVYSLPFKGDWFVFWGGTNVLVNYHYAIPAQRYAADLVKAVNNYSYKGDPKKNESYFAFAQDIIAPKEGTVVEAVDEYEDNFPVGTTNPDNPPEGNHVVIDHGHGEYSLLAHLKKGSVKVSKGDIVKKGDLLALCGNSGNSSEPHLHFQVSDHPLFTEGKSRLVRFEGNPEVLIGRTLKGSK
ncbi:M23 family metallopeptidase [Paenibacillus tuaregi]|uniref:M23 family metallopeptidase n=1 Tax=Paenibacillus tuaregi TaxID=1816681 RepID=UPI000837FF4B|nr:M23 family metallopeptidase [Paenibacillus tuaregi]